MLVNLSNHPSMMWAKEQMETALLLYGTVGDCPFPDVEPGWSVEEVERLADDRVNWLLETFGQSIVVHVMGEMTFTYAVVSRLKAKGVVCVASTTERCVYVAADGRKVSDFRFVQFRQY